VTEARDADQPMPQGRLQGVVETVAIDHEAALDVPRVRRVRAPPILLRDTRGTSDDFHSSGSE
jgi:hypothetical protein